MIDNIRLMLGNSASNYSDAQIDLMYKRAVLEIEAYCKREIDFELSMVAEEIAVIKLNRMGTEGLSNQSYSGVSEGYIDGYPKHLQQILNAKRKIKAL